MNHAKINKDIFFDQIEKKIYSKRQYFKVLDNFILPFLISFCIFLIVSFLLLIFSGIQVNSYMDKGFYKNFANSQNSAILQYLDLWSNNNKISIITGNIGAVFGILLTVILLMELIGSKTKNEKIETHKKNVMIFTTIYSIVLSLFVFIVLNTLSIPIGFDENNVKFILYNETNPLNIFKFIVFNNDKFYNNLLDYNFDSTYTKGNYLVFSLTTIIFVAICSITSTIYFSIFFILNIKNKKYLNVRIDDLNFLNETIKEINNVKEITSNDNPELNYYQKQTEFFKNNKNKFKKIPQSISYTQEIDLSKKEHKKLIQKESEDKDSITPSPSKKGMEKLKNKRKIDDLFFREIE